jgi:uncharacterized protein (DUF697 family)
MNMTATTAELAHVEAPTTEAPKAKPHFSDVDVASNVKATDQIIKNHALGAAGIGLIPLPGVDVLALSALQLNLLRKLGEFYQLSFTEEVGKKLIAAVLSSYTPIALAAPVASLFKIIPVVGQVIGGFAASGTSGAATYALGKVFVQHFESGGTFLDFNPTSVREYFYKQFKEGKGVIETAKAEETATKA